MKYLIDTHVLLWWFLDSFDLPNEYQSLFDQHESKKQEVGISIISLWEIAKLVENNKLTIRFSLDDWFEELENDPILEIFPLSRNIVLESTRLREHGFHKDPADQMIVATARCHQLRLLTQDERIRQSGAVLVV